MNILNESFDKVYLITSYSTCNRLVELLSFFNKENIEVELVVAPKKQYFIPDPNLHKTPGTYSHLSAVESIFLKESFVKSNSFAVMEDDIFFADDYVDKLKLFFQMLPNDWDVLNLGFHEWTSLKSQDANVVYKLQKEERMCGTHFVAYKHNTVSFMMDKLSVCGYPMDWFLCDEIYSNFKTYACLDQIFYASSYRENENHQHFTYKKYKSEFY